MENNQVNSFRTDAGDGIHINNDEDDSMEIRLRQEEIQNLITGNLGDYDSTLNSTINTINSIIGENHNGNREIDNSPLESGSTPLQVLYEVRSREVQALSDELHKLQADKTQEKLLYETKCTLLESELQQARISVKQAQELLVAKTDEAREQQMRLNKANDEVSELKNVIKKLEMENNSFRTINEDLNNKILMIESGIVNTAGKMNDRQIHEEYERQLLILERQLESSLNTTKSLEKQVVELRADIQKITQGKEDILFEKNKLISHLTASIENTQKQACDSTESFQKLKIEFEQYKEEAEQAKAILNRVLQSNRVNRIQDLDMHVSELKNKLLENELRLATFANQLKEKEQQIQELENLKETANVSIQAELNPKLGGAKLELFNEFITEIHALNFLNESPDVMVKISELKNLLKQIIKMNNREKLVDSLNNISRSSQDLLGMNRLTKDDLIKNLKHKTSELVTANQITDYLTSSLKTAQEEYDTMSKRYLTMVKEAHFTIQTLKEKLQNVGDECEKLKEEKDALKAQSEASSKERDLIQLELQKTSEDLQLVKSALDTYFQKAGTEVNEEPLPTTSQIELQRIQQELELRNELKEEFAQKLKYLENKYKNAKVSECKKHKQKINRLVTKIRHYQTAYGTSRTEIIKFVECCAAKMKSLEDEFDDVCDDRDKVRGQLEKLTELLRDREEKLDLCVRSLKRLNKNIALTKRHMYGNLSAVSDFFTKATTIVKETDSLITKIKK